MKKKVVGEKKLAIVKKVQPKTPAHPLIPIKKVIKINCQKCGELLLKTYPWCILSQNVQIFCGICENKKRS